MCFWDDRRNLDVHFINTLPVLVASRHAREACPVLDTGAGIQETTPEGLHARLRGHDVLLAPDLRNGHLVRRFKQYVRQNALVSADPFDDSDRHGCLVVAGASPSLVLYQDRFYQLIYCLQAREQELLGNLN